MTEPTIRTDWTRDEITALFNMPFMDLVYEAQTVHRTYHPRNEVQLSTLLSIKTGGCSEDCGYCSQSVEADSGVKASKLMDVRAIERSTGSVDLLVGGQLLVAGDRPTQLSVTKGGDGLTQLGIGRTGSSLRISQGRIASLLLGLLLPALPPLALIGLASPLAGVGLLLPATGLAGGVAYVLAGVVWFGSPRVHVRASAAIGLMGIAAIAQTATAPNGASDPHWQAVSTAVGGPLAETRSPPDATAIEQLRITMGRSSSENVVLPESYFRAWSAATDAFLEPLWRRLAKDGRSVTFGAQRLNAATGQIDNLVLVRGAFRDELSQHYPVPLSMYRFGAAGSVPMRWRGSYVLPMGSEHPAVLICWEQLLLAPMLRVMLESPRPTRLIAASNLYFARGTPVARIQRASVAAWARLLGVPFVYAINE